MGDYVRAYVREIAVVEMPANGYAGINDMKQPRVVFNVTYVHELTDALKAGLLLHETRHLELQHGHTCPNGWADATMEEGGAIAVHVEYLTHAGVHGAADWYRRFAIGC